MNFTKLVIEVGGLCMYVKRQDPLGLYILMPNVAAHHVRPHCAMLIANSQNTPNGKRMIYPLKGQVLDLAYLTDGPEPTCDLSWALDASKFAGGKQVADDFILGRPKDCLASRIRLPISCCPDPEKRKRAKMRVDGFNDELLLAGRATITIAVTKQGDGVLHVPKGDDLHPDNNGTISITLANVPREELDRTNYKNHSKGEVADHYQAYYSLLADNCSAGRGGPKVRIDEDVTNGDDKDLEPKDCPTGPTEWPNTLRIEWVDTYTCSSGRGG